MDDLNKSDFIQIIGCFVYALLTFPNNAQHWQPGDWHEANLVKRHGVFNNMVEYSSDFG